MPRQLQEQETTESLHHWFVTFRNYFRRDDLYKQFLHTTFVWDPTAVDYGLSAEDTGMKRTAALLKEDLVAFLEILAGFLPNSYVTERIVKNSTSMRQAWQFISELYEAEVSNDTFLDFAAIVKSPTESYRQMFERMVNHVHKHLTKPNTTVENYSSGATGDVMTLSLLNLTVIIWMDKINKRLIDQVRLEFATDLKAGTELYQLMPRIARCVDQLLQRVEHQGVRQVQDLPDSQADSDEAQVNRVRQQYQQRYGRNNNNSGPRNNNNARQGRAQQHCPHCDFLQQILNMRINTDHDPDRCPRKKAAIRLVQDDADDCSGQSLSMSTFLPNSSSLQTVQSPNCCHLHSNPAKTSDNCDMFYSLPVSQYHATHPCPISDTFTAKILKLTSLPGFTCGSAS